MLTDSICMATDQVQEQIEQLISVKSVDWKSIYNKLLKINVLDTKGNVL